MHDLGETTSIDVLAGQIGLAGTSIVDIGCGGMAFSRQLCEHGARVTAIDPDPVQAERNRAAAPIAGLEFIEAPAESIPVADNALDGACFSFSLHHVPARTYPQVFSEIRRVVRPGGFLCVIEPTDSDHNTVMKHFHDETLVRAAAQDALRDLAIPVFATHAVYRYHSYVEYDSFDEFVERYGSKTFNPEYTVDDVRAPAVRESFERLGAPNYRFESPKMMMLLQGRRESAAVSSD